MSVTFSSTQSISLLKVLPEFVNSLKEQEGYLVDDQTQEMLDLIEKVVAAINTVVLL